MGLSAIEQILNNRPFENAEDLLFKEEITYSKLNKKSLDALCRAGALNNLIDDRFTGAKHFWTSVAVERPKSQKKFKENIEEFSPEGNFTEEEKIEYISSLTGISYDKNKSETFTISVFQDARHRTKHPLQTQLLLLVIESKVMH